jgi:hypothetical protein
MFEYTVLEIEAQIQSIDYKLSLDCLCKSDDARLRFMRSSLVLIKKLCVSYDSYVAMHP